VTVERPSRVEAHEILMTKAAKELLQAIGRNEHEHWDKWDWADRLAVIEAEVLENVPT
jgi:hypothetical protein